MLLATSTWVIYNADRLIDAIRIQSVPQTKRHLFFQKYFDHLFILTLLVALLSLTLLSSVSLLVIKWGVLVFFITGLILLFGNQIYPLKEMLIALVYSISLFIPSWIGGTDFFAYRSLFLFISFFLLALQNLILFSLVESSQDRSMGFKSIVLKTPQKAKVLFAVVFFLWFLVIAIMFFLSIPKLSLWIIIVSMGLALQIVFYFRERLSEREVYRYLADGVFLIPGLILIG